MSQPAWQSLGQVSPRELVDARLQLHHAAQLVAAVGKSLLEPRLDDSHPNLGWLAAERALAGHVVPGPRPFQAALRPAELELILLAGDGEIAESLCLPGETLAGAAAWLAGAIESRFDRPLPSGLTSPGYDLPPHPVAEGSAFAVAPTEAFAELGRWFGDADVAFRGFAESDEASDVRCWPHHFDLATLLTLATGADGSATKTVGLGLSPGDETVAEPYWYVSPWPYPDPATELPALPEGGHWHREGFTAAILTGTALIGQGPAEQQPERLRVFLEAALASSRRALAL